MNITLLCSVCGHYSEIWSTLSEAKKKGGWIASKRSGLFCCKECYAAKQTELALNSDQKETYNE